MSSVMEHCLRVAEQDVSLFTNCMRSSRHPTACGTSSSLPRYRNTQYKVARKQYHADEAHRFHQDHVFLCVLDDISMDIHKRLHCCPHHACVHLLGSHKRSAVPLAPSITNDVLVRSPLSCSLSGPPLPPLLTLQRHRRHCRRALFSIARCKL